MKKIDVVCQTYGKSNQLLVTLKSLMKWSGQYIDKIYLIEEKQKPFGDSGCEWILKHFDNIVYHQPDNYINPYSVPASEVPYELVRHQWGLDKSDKKWVFICHNDCLITGDIIGGILQEIENFERNNPNQTLAGVSEIGQCHNCPALQICGGGAKWNDWNPSFEDIYKLKLPHIRTRMDNLHPTIPKLVPECRLNEYACMINRELKVDKKENLFGSFSEDSGVNWFRYMHEKGYKFIDYRKHYHHGYWSPKTGGSGYNAQQNYQLYIEAEENARQYFKEHFENK